LQHGQRERRQCVDGVRDNSLNPGRDAKLIEEKVIALVKESNVPVPAGG
jgi:hypothetical protein